MLEVSKTDERLLDLKDLSHAEVDEIETALRLYITVNKNSRTLRNLLTKLLIDKKKMKRD